MASLAGTTSHSDAVMALSRLDATLRAASVVTALDRLHTFLAEGAPERVQGLLGAAHARASRIAATGGENTASDTAAAQAYAADVLAALAAEGDLDATDARITAGALAETCSLPLATANLCVYRRTAASPALLDLPPIVASEIILRLLIDLEVAEHASLWRRTTEEDVECLVAFGIKADDRRLRADAGSAIKGRSRMRLVSRSALAAAPVSRFGKVEAVILALPGGKPPRDISAHLDGAAEAMTPLLERELLLTRSAAREQALLGTTENRITRLGFDLHDGPVQDVLALSAEVHRLRDDLYPFILGSHRELAVGRFDDIVGRLGEIDRRLRETSHSLELHSVASRPLAEILHREVEAFSKRAGIAGSIDVQGDPESLSSQQRVALFRGIQEALSNVREHSGATKVDVRLTVRRGTIEVRVTDNGHGFEVSRSLALAAERGRLGLVGIGERMRMLGGTFEVDSRPGGPSVLRFSLPRWEPFDPMTGESR